MYKNKEFYEKVLKGINYNDVILIIAYGSRIYGNAGENSDLDILVISSKKGKYKKLKSVDGISIDMTVMTLEDAQESITISKVTGNSYFDSILKNGIVIIDKFDTYNNLCNLLFSKQNKKRFLDKKLLGRMEYHFSEFLGGTGNKKIHYYSALELLRKLLHAKYNCSNIQSSKVYDLYIDKQFAKEKYMLKLPSDELIKDYLRALEESREEKQKEWLIKFYKELELKKEVDIEEEFLDNAEIKMKLINLNNAIKKCKNMILKKHSYSIALYYIIIGEMLDFYEQVYKKELKVNFDLSCNNEEQMVNNLENLFDLIEYYKLDYENYTIKF